MAENVNIDQLQIEIAASSADAAKQVNELAKAMNRLKKSLGGTWKNPIQNVTGAIGGSRGVSRGPVSPPVPQDMGKTDATVGSFTGKVEVLREELGKVQTAASGAFKGMTAEQVLAMSETDRLTARISALKSELDDAIKSGKPESRILSLANQIKRLEEQTITIHVDTEEVEKADSKLGRLWGSIKRIAMYRLIRTAMKIVAQAIKEGLENAYEYSKLMGGGLAKSLDKLTSKSQKLKNQLGAALGEVIEAAEPILSDLLDELVEVAKTLTSIFSSIGAILKTLYTTVKPLIDYVLAAVNEILAAVRTIFDLIGRSFGDTGYLVADDVEKSWKDASNAAKEYKKILLGIDEINKLNEEDKTDDSSTFHTEPIAANGDGDGINWIKPLIIDIDNIRAAMKELVAEAVTAKQAIEANQPVFSLNAEPALRTVFLVEYELSRIAQFVPELAFAPIPESVIASVTSLVNALSSMQTVLIPLLQQFPVMLTFAIQNPVPALAAIVSAAMATYAPLFSMLPVMLTFAVQNPIPAIVTIASGAMSAFEPLLEKLPVNITFEVENPLPKIQQFLDTALQTIGEEITEITARVQEFNRVLDGALSSFLQEESSRIMTFIARAPEWGPPLVEAVGKTLADIVATINPGIGLIMQTVVSHLQEMGGSIITPWGQSVVQFFQNLWKSINLVFDGIRNAIDSIRNSTIGKIIGLDSATVKNTQFAIPAMSLPIPVFAGGGFPEDGLFMANHGELIGQFSNGRSAVANNEQIVDGISKGVSDANEDLISVVSAGFSQIIAAIESSGGGGGMSLDGLASGLYPKMQAISTRIGATL